MISKRIKQINAGGHSYLDGDWLINYEGGFIRRGLFGEILTLFNFNAKNSLYLILTFQVTMYLILILTLLIIAFKSKSRSFNYLILLNPAGFMFGYIDWGGGFRKEIIFYASLALLYLSLNFNKYYLSYLSIILFYFGSLSWEGLLFFSPIYSLMFVKIIKINYLSQNNFNLNFERTRKKFLIIFNTFNLFLLILLLFFRGGVKSANQICQSLTWSNNFDKHICDGSIYAIGWPLTKFLNDTLDKFPEYFIYLFYFILALLPFILLFRNFLQDYKIRLIVLSTIPLYILAIDYGRWISMTILIFTFAVVIFDLPKRNLELPMLLCVIYIVSWGLPHWFNHITWLSLLGKFWSEITGLNFPVY